MDEIRQASETKQGSVSGSFREIRAYMGATPPQREGDEARWQIGCVRFTAGQE